MHSAFSSSKNFHSSRQHSIRNVRFPKTHICTTVLVFRVFSMILLHLLYHLPIFSLFEPRIIGSPFDYCISFYHLIWHTEPGGFAPNFQRILLQRKEPSTHRVTEWLRRLHFGEPSWTGTALRRTAWLLCVRGRPTIPILTVLL